MVKIRSILFGVFLLSIAIMANAYAEQQPLDDPVSILKVSDTTFSHSKENGYNIITTIGTIKNPSNIRICELVVEVKYFDQAKKLIDTVTQPLYGIVVPPAREVGFRVRDRADKPMDAYISSTVRVVSAAQQGDRSSIPQENSTFWIRILITWLPLILFLGLLLFATKRTAGKNSPQQQTIELQKRTIESIEKQNTILSKQLEAVERLASAVEKAASR
ncbi:MAG: hypothetical protein HQK60_11745 [Deltaproteobacteria bacterium]|nr:hypothetical protein [Deltaproteobacteria bacterium]